MKKAVILAGGLGIRLRPLTQVIPKALLPIGEKAVLEIQISRLKRYGFEDIYLATNYKSDYISAFFGNGSRLGVNLIISKEKEALGTCGALSLIKYDLMNEPFIVMNGDILTTIDFDRLYRAALKFESDFTVVTKEFVTPFAFGNVFSADNYITGIEEKPDIKNEIVAGIYVMKPHIFEYIPDDEYFGMDHLIKKLLNLKIPVARYLMNEYWLDIGQLDDYEKAQDVYQTYFKEEEKVLS